MTDPGMWWITEIKETPGIDGVEVSVIASLPLESQTHWRKQLAARVRLTGPDLRALNAAMRKATGESE